MLRLQTSKYLFGIIAVGLAGCMFGGEPDGGQADPQYAARVKDKKEKAVYVAVGNSLTSGFQSAGLRGDWQEASYPALIADAMGSDDFQLPLIDTPGIGTRTVNGRPATPLMLEGNAITVKPLTRPIGEMLLNYALPRPYNNLGVPGATTLDFLRAYNQATAQDPTNAYFNMILRAEMFQNATMLRQAIRLRPKVMTLWLGSNDILGGVTSGTVVEGSTVTPVAVYTALMDLALDTLLRETKADIFIANIPSIVTIPYVTTVPKVVIDANFQPVLINGSPVPLLTQESNVKYVLFPALAAFQRGIGIPAALGGAGTPLPGDLTLTEAEAAIADRLTDGYNAYLKRKACNSRLTLVDINQLLLDVKNGNIPGLTSTHPLLDPAGTAFSLDGIHPNTRGYRFVANRFIEAINGALHKKFPKVPTD
jgi:lysophospholipase L1-like esterase